MSRQATGSGLPGHAFSQTDSSPSKGVSTAHLKRRSWASIRPSRKGCCGCPGDHPPVLQGSCPLASFSGKLQFPHAETTPPGNPEGWFTQIRNFYLLLRFIRRGHELAQRRPDHNKHERGNGADAERNYSEVVPGVTHEGEGARAQRRPRHEAQQNAVKVIAVSGTAPRDPRSFPYTSR